MTQSTAIDKLEKGRAEFAYRCVSEAVNSFDRETAKKYRSYVRRTPSMILSNGLGATLAFINSKKEKSWKKLYDQIKDYLCSKHTIRIVPLDKSKDLVEQVISCNSQRYRYLTEETLAFLNWLKKFAEGMIPEE